MDKEGSRSGFIDSETSAPIVAAMDTFRTQFRAQRLAKGLTLAKAAEYFGVSAQRIWQWERLPTERPDHRKEAKVLKWMDIEPAEYELVEIDGEIKIAPREGSPQRSLENFSGPASHIVAHNDVIRGTDAMSLGPVPMDIPVRKTTYTRRGGDFAMGSLEIDRAPRPSGIATARQVFAIDIITDVMSPKYERGDRVYISAARAPIPGDCVVVELRSDDDEKPCLFRRLKEIGDKHLILESLNPARDEVVPIESVGAIYRVVPYRELAGL